MPCLHRQPDCRLANSRQKMQSTVSVRPEAASSQTISTTWPGPRGAGSGLIRSTILVISCSRILLPDSVAFHQRRPYEAAEKPST